MLETMIQDAQQKYESTVRLHLQKMQKDALDVDHRKFPQLYANVRKWQDQLEPVLKEFDSRPEFDIHEYSTSLLSKMSALQDTDEEQVVPFSRLVQGQPRWEVCRRFLSCLFLTNQGNTDILFSGEEERLNHFRIKLLSAEKKMISLEEEEGRDQTKQARAGRGKKSLKKLAASRRTFFRMQKEVQMNWKPLDSSQRKSLDAATGLEGVRGQCQAASLHICEAINLDLCRPGEG